MIFSVACGAAPQMPLEPSAGVNALSASSGMLPAKMEQGQPEAMQPAGVSQPVEAPMQKAAFSAGQDPSPENTAQSPGQEPALDASVQAAAETSLASVPVSVLSAEQLPPVAPKIGFLAPDFTLQTLDGQSVNLSDLRGRPVLINYWTSWCIPCKDELPTLERIYKDYQGQGLVILSVNAIDQDTLTDAQQTVQQYAISAPVLLDQGEVIWNAYEVMFFPTSFLVDSNGIIRDIVLGSASEEKFRTKIDALIAGAY